MEIDTPNLHTPPEKHGPPEPREHSHLGEDVEAAFDKHDLSHPQPGHEDHDHPHHPHEEPPMVILDRRFAKGEITKEVYLEAKELLHKK